LKFYFKCKKNSSKLVFLSIVKNKSNNYNTFTTKMYMQIADEKEKERNYESWIYWIGNYGKANE